MFIQFLGTSAGTPSINRNVTSIALVFNELNCNVWLFDCGEATQHQLLHTSIKLNKIKKIFITHMHGDHIFGLPGLLTSRSINTSSSKLEIYGGKGIKSYVIKNLKFSNSYINFPLDIYEIQEGEIFNSNKVKVTAFLLRHTIECYGYKIEEYDKQGHIKVNKLVKKGIYPGPIYKIIKKGYNILFNDVLLKYIDYITPYSKGKSFVILGDTRPFLNLKKFINKVDVLVHESTLHHILVYTANERGHSTNKQAALLAKYAHVKKLILTHFSTRYTYYQIKCFLKECIKIFPNTKIAYDFSLFYI